MKKLWTGLLAFSLLVSSGVNASLLSFDFIFADVATGSGAKAEGTIVFDEALFGDGSALIMDLAPVVSLDLEVTGTASVDGLYDIADFTGLVFDTVGTALDLSKELVGQTLSNGNAFGTCPFGECGDFNLFSSDPNTIPNGVWYFILGAGNGGEGLSLTSFKATAVSEPASLALFGLGLLGLAGLRRRG